MWAGLRKVDGWVDGVWKGAWPMIGVIKGQGRAGPVWAGFVGGWAGLSKGPVCPGGWGPGPGTPGGLGRRQRGLAGHPQAPCSWVNPVSFPAGGADPTAPRKPGKFAFPSSLPSVPQAG